LEPYKEIVNIEEYFFFKGLADLKYGAVHNRYLSEKSTEEHYAHRDYYDIEISQVEKFPSPEDFNKWKPKFQLNTIRNDFFVVHFEGKEYGVKADMLYIHESLYVDHVQVEGEDLHGDFAQVPVAFRMHKKSQLVRCIPNYPTGKEEQREDGLYKEYTTGEFEDDGETCSTTWISDSLPPPITCPINESTGKRETKNKCYRLEYYSGSLNADGVTCETYWGEWICNCVQDEWTGNEKELDGWIWREYFNADCTTYWKQYKIGPTGPGPGCLSYLPFILAILWAALCCYWAVKYGSFMPILFGIGIPLFLAGFGYAINFFGKFSRFIGRMFAWFLNLLIFFFILFLLNGLGSFFNDSNWRGESIPVDTSWDKQEILPEDRDNGTSVIDTDEGRRIQRDKVTVKLKWNDLDNNRYEGVYSIFKDEIASSSNNLKNLETQKLNSFASVYFSIYNTDKNYLSNLYTMLDSIRVNKKLSNIAFANAIVSMVQSIDYVLILEQDCNDPSVMRNNELRKMRESGVPCIGYAPYGIKTPTEFLSGLKGDCDTRTLLLYTIFKHYNYDVAILNSAYYGHSMLGLNVQGAMGTHKLLKGKRYYFWETTSKGFGLGQLPQENGSLNYWKIELN
jgi:hypothetical protein